MRSEAETERSENEWKGRQCNESPVKNPWIELQYVKLS